MAKSKNVLLGVTGSIAAFRAADIIRRLRDEGCSVTAMMTRGAQQFITPLTLGSLSGKKVYTEMFDENDSAWEMGHITLAQKGGVFLIAPATANIIGKIANGIADDLITCTAMATEAKILIAPAMNDNMFKNKVVQDNVTKLKRTGVHFIEPIKGKLACGTEGIGHLAKVEIIVKATLRFLK